MIKIPSDHKQIIKLARDLIEQCRSSVGVRGSYYRDINAIAETGTSTGRKSLLNLMNVVLGRTSGHLYSPTELRFAIDFDNEYDKAILNKASRAARHLTMNFSRTDTDQLFGRGVFDALKYGCVILKQWPQQIPAPYDPSNFVPKYNARLVMPWQFGVYREDENSIDEQAVLVETTMMTLPQIWQRIWHLPEAEKLYAQIAQHASDGGETIDGPLASSHPIWPGTQLSLDSSSATPGSGGIVQLFSQPDYSVIAPNVTAPMVMFHEIWIQGDKDWRTIQLVEPDILITRYKINNLLSGDLNSRLQPYSIIQPNIKSGMFWGISELSDLIRVQQWLSTTADDVQRLFGLQVDKILGFVGFDGMKDETYDQFRSSGYLSLPAGSDIKDITPQFPAEAMPMLRLLIDFINLVGGYPNLMLGQGDAGVRSGVQTDTLLKTGSPRLRTQSLTVERQCAKAADTRFSMMQIKDGRKFWTDGSTAESVKNTSFLLSDIPQDRVITVDSHSASPIFADDHEQLIAFGIKAGFLDGEDAIEDLPYPEKEKKKARLRERQQAKAAETQKMMQQYPQLAETIAKKSITGR